MIGVAVLVAQLTLVLGAGLLLARLLRRRSAALRHAVLMASVLCVAILPLAGRVAPAWWPLPSPTVAVSESDGQGDTARASTTFTVTEQAATASPAVPITVPMAIAGAWALAAAWAVALLARDLWRLRRLSRFSAPLRDARWTRLLAEARASLGVASPVALHVGGSDAPVVTWGLRRPRILVPSLATAWPDAQVRHVLVHELAHVVRRDWAWHLVLAVIAAAYGWHPLMRLAVRAARREAERACDDVVLRAGARASSYASTLLDVARSRRAAPAIATVAMADASSLEQRITAMLDPTVDRSPLPRMARSLMAGTALAFTVAVAGIGAQAQADGLVTGRVMPAGGTPLAGVTISFTGPTSATVETDAQGQYTATLPGGTYRAEIRKPGFKAFAARVDVAPGETATRDFALALGTVRESIVVSAAPPSPASAAPFHRPAPPQADPFGGTLEPPKKLKDVKPVYADELKAAGIVGKVVLGARIGVDGFVTDVQVVSSPHDGLTAAAVEAVEQWKFAPTMLQGKPVPTEMTVTIEFSAR